MSEFTVRTRKFLGRNHSQKHQQKGLYKHCHDFYDFFLRGTLGQLDSRVVLSFCLLDCWLSEAQSFLTTHLFAQFGGDWYTEEPSLYSQVFQTPWGDLLISDCDGLYKNYIPGTQMIPVLIGKGLLLEGWSPKIEDEQVSGCFRYTHISGPIMPRQEIPHQKVESIQV